MHATYSLYSIEKIPSIFSSISKNIRSKNLFISQSTPGTWLSYAFVQLNHSRQKLSRFLYYSLPSWKSFHVALTAWSDSSITACKSTKSLRWWDPTFIFLALFVVFSLAFHTSNIFRSPMVNNTGRSFRNLFFLNCNVIQRSKLLIQVE